MKICIISFDIWGFDSFIKTELEKENVEAYHICLSQYKYKYKSIKEKIKNVVYKTFLNRNIKHINREKHILNELNKMGHFDQILIINSELISLETHIKIKQKTNKYITFLYDSLDRMPVKKSILNLFNTIYSFDKKDCQKNGFNFITNYIYQEIIDLKTVFKYKSFCILSEDNRIETLLKIDSCLKHQNLPSKFLVYHKKDKSILDSNIVYTNQRISINEVKDYLNDSEIFIDLIRDNQTGLSFRVFESLAFQRKLITTNESIKEFDFYNENNILIIDKKNPIIPKSFFEKNYEIVPQEIIKKYTLSSWCKKVFNL